jgi:hypothetical protein
MNPTYLILLLFVGAASNDAGLLKLTLFHLSQPVSLHPYEISSCRIILTKTAKEKKSESVGRNAVGEASLGFFS